MIAMMHCDDFVITYFSLRLPFLAGHVRLSSCLKVILMKIDEVVLHICTYILELDMYVPQRDGNHSLQRHERMRHNCLACDGADVTVIFHVSRLTRDYLQLRSRTTRAIRQMHNASM